MQLANNFDGGTGAAAGVMVSAANSGGAYQTPISHSASTTIYSSTAYSGNLSFTSQTNSAWAGWNPISPAGSRTYMRGHLRVAKRHTSSLTMGECVVGSNPAVTLYMLTDGTLRLGVGRSGTWLTAATAAVPINQWVRVELFHDHTTKGGGLWLYTDPASATHTSYVDGTNASMVSGAATSAAFEAWAATQAQSWWDSIAIADSKIGPIDTTPPTAPGNLRVVEVTGTQFTVAWDPSVDAASGLAGYGVWLNGGKVTGP